MKILFIYSLYEIVTLSKPLRSQEQIQFGISYISAVLKRQGHQTKLIVLSRISGKNNNRKILDHYIKSFQPRLICFTAIFSEYEFIASIARYLKEHYGDIFLLIGGVHVSLNPEEAIKDDFDAVCIGEGEYPTLELLNHLEKGIQPSGIRNLWIKNGAGIERNEPRPLLEDLDSLPFLDREMWQEWIGKRLDSYHSVLLGRGCPFECTYCSNHALKKISPGRYVRFRSTEKIIEELKEVTKRFPDNQSIYLEIETFYTNKNWVLELCSKLENLNKSLSSQLQFGVNLRITPNTDYEELFSACKKSNFRFINIGLESGSERVRSDILKRNYSNSDIIKTVNLARKYNLKVAFFNLIGIPGETYDDFKKTMKMNRICLPDWIMTSIFFPYPGTVLFSICKNNGFLDSFLDTEMERGRAILDLPSFPKKLIKKENEWFYYNVYKGHRPMYKLLLSVFVAKLRPYSNLFHFYVVFSRSLLYKRLKAFIEKNFISDKIDNKHSTTERYIYEI